MDSSAYPSEAEVDAVIEEFGGDLRAAIRALLHDVSVLASDYKGAVSAGYVRGRAAPGGARQTMSKRAGSEGMV